MEYYVRAFLVSLFAVAAMFVCGYHAMAEAPEDTFGMVLPEDQVQVLDSGAHVLDSGVPPGTPTMEQNISAIRRDLDVLVYGIFPLCVIVFLVVCFCKWFKRTFVDSAF